MNDYEFKNKISNKLKELSNEAVEDISKESNLIKDQEIANINIFDNLQMLSNRYLDSFEFDNSDGITFKDSFLIFLKNNGLLLDTNVSFRTSLKLFLFGYISSFTLVLLVSLGLIFFNLIYFYTIHDFNLNWFITVSEFRNAIETAIFKGLYYVVVYTINFSISLYLVAKVTSYLRNRNSSVNIARRMKK